MFTNHKNNRFQKKLIVQNMNMSPPPPLPKLSSWLRPCSKNPNIRPNYKTRLIPIFYWLECRDLCFALKCKLNVQLEEYIQIPSGRTRSSSDSLNLLPVHRYRTSLFGRQYDLIVGLFITDLPAVKIVSCKQTTRGVLLQKISYDFDLRHFL